MTVRLDVYHDAPKAATIGNMVIKFWLMEPSCSLNLTDSNFTINHTSQ